MQLELKRRIGETSNQFQLESVTIERYQSLCQAPNLLIVKNDFTAINDDNGNHAHREIFKPVFIASCKTRFENQLLVLFYYAAPFELKGYVIGGLPKIYENSEDGVCIVDYKSYCDICDITNETKMSLIKYYEIISGDNSEVIPYNTMLSYNGEELNCDKQKALWANSPK